MAIRFASIMSLSNTFLLQVKQKNKRLFYVMIICMIVTIAVNISRNEITPFYIWSMYSAPAAEADTFSLYIFEYNNNQVYNEPHTFMDHRRMMLYYTIDAYAGLLDNNRQEADKSKALKWLSRTHTNTPAFSGIFNSDRDIDNYPTWLKRYMAENTGIKIDSIKVYRNWVKYSSDGHVYPVKSELILKA